jgi:hypothetical protein
MKNTININAETNKTTAKIQWVSKLLGTHIIQNKSYDFNENPI